MGNYDLELITLKHQFSKQNVNQYKTSGNKV